MSSANYFDLNNEREISETLAESYRTSSFSESINGTGWLLHNDYVNSTDRIVLVSIHRNVLRSAQYKQGSGTDRMRAIVHAIAWANENPDSFVATKEELIAHTMQSNRRFDSWISLAADSVERLRAIDLDRVLSQAQSPSSLQACAAYLCDKRKDLAESVKDLVADICSDNGWKLA